MTNYDSLADSLARAGFYAHCHCQGAGKYEVTLWNSKLKYGRQPRGTGETSLDALTAANNQRVKYEAEQA